MKIGITYRLFLALLAAASLAVVSMFLIMQWSIGRGFLRYVNTMEAARLERLAGELEQFYAREGSWTPLKTDREEWLRLMMATIPGEEPGTGHREWRGRRLERRLRGDEPPPPGLHPPRGGQRFEMRVVLLDGKGETVLAPQEYGGGGELRPLKYRGEVVGRLGLLPRKRLSDVQQLRFVKEQRLALALVGAVVLFLAAGLSLPLANRLLRPIRALASATDRLAAGRFDTRVPVAGSDELTLLARNFNALALTLEKNEAARRQWVADISHELRTPLAVLRGEVEAIQDGIRQPTPETIRSLHGEVLRLGRLVDDLYQLSLTDLGALTYRMEMLDLAEAMEHALDLHCQEFARKGIMVETDLPRPGSVPLFADRERLQQLFANLFANALKYTDAGGKLVVRLACAGGRATIDLMDSAPGVPETELARLFERLYRVESSRNRETGGAGLGLAICRNIVEAHGGEIEALASPLGGVWIRMTLPVKVTS